MAYKGSSVNISILEVHQHLGVVLMLLHLGRGHQNCADPFGQVLHVRGEGGVLQQGWRGTRGFQLHSVRVHTYQMMRRSFGGKT